MIIKEEISVPEKYLDMEVAGTKKQTKKKKYTKALEKEKGKNQ